jgi:ADP-ribosylation factor GTPase-activating protein 1
VTYGTLICLECSGQHRGLGVHVSFVRSVTMDSWSEKQINAMRLGGNRKMRDWFSERGVPNNMRISAKYHTPDAEYYGRRLKALVEGKEVPAMPPRAPVDTSVDYSRGDPNGKERLKGESDEDYIARQRKLTDAARERMRAKFGNGGGMGGIGSDPNYDPSGGGGGGIPSVDGVKQGLVGLWGTVRQTAAAANEELRKRELGKKLREGVATASETVVGTYQTNVDEETRAKLRENTVGARICGDKISN